MRHVTALRINVRQLEILKHAVLACILVLCLPLAHSYHHIGHRVLEVLLLTQSDPQFRCTVFGHIRLLLLPISEDFDV